jgi:iron complex outermembrane receptor protein
VNLRFPPSTGPRQTLRVHPAISTSLSLLLLLAPPSFAQEKIAEVASISSPPLLLARYDVSERGVTRANNVLSLPDIAPTSPPGTNPLLLLNRLPGVNNNASSTFGIRGSDGASLRLRAFTLNVIGTAIDGIPVSTSNGFQSQPPSRLVDGENLSSIVVSQGSGDVTTPSYSALGGSINFFTRAPEKDPAAQLSATYGSNEFRRGFVRVDSGEILPGLTAFISGSNATQITSFTDSDLPHHKRTKLDAQLSYETPLLSLNGAVSYSKSDDHDDRPISGSYFGNWQPYTPGGPTGDLSDGGRHWFYPTIDDGNPNALESVNYDKNRNGYTETLYRVRAVFTPSTDLKISATPYYQDRDGYHFGGVPYTTARSLYEAAIRAQPGRTDIVAPLGYPTASLAATNTLPTGVTSLASVDAPADNKPNAREALTPGHRSGLPIGIEWKIDHQTFEAGAWFETEKSSSIRRLHNVVGGIITNPFDWSTFITTYFNQQTELSTQQYFFKDTIKLIDDRLSLAVGVKALTVTTDFQGYPDSTYFDRGLWVRRKPTYSDYFLPQVGATFALTSKDEVFFNYAENFAAPSTAVISGTVFDQSKLEAERANNLDLGIRTTRGKLSASLAGYFIQYKNRIGDVTAYDPLGFGTANTATNYVNVGQVHGYGTELALAYAATRDFHFNLAAAYQSLTYSDNYSEATSSGSTIVREIKNHTVPNTPRWNTNADATYFFGAFFLGVNAHYQSGVYLTTNNLQRIPGYTLYGLGLGYDGIARKGRLKNVRIALNVENLFDRYWYYTTGASTAYSNGNFNVGTPRAVFATVSSKF